MSFKDTQSYKEIRSDWRWIHSMDPDAAAEADRWMAEHPEERKELEHILYYSEANFHKRVGFDSLEDAEMKQPISYNPEAFLPEEVRNRIYDDKRWFNRAAYLPPDSEEDPEVYLSKQLAEALHELTELQRQVIFRNVVNGESTESIAQDMGCTSRNVRDIRNRALKALRTKITKHEGIGYIGEHHWIAVPALLVVGLLLLLLLQLDFTIPEWVQYIAVAVAAPPVLWVLWHGRNREVEDLLQRHWAYMNGSQKKK